MILISKLLRKGKGLSIFRFFLFLFFFLLEEMVGFCTDFGKLSNGLEYIIEKREGSGVVAIQIWVRVGSKKEDDRLAGITHFIEHLIFKGTERLSANEMASKIESMGGIINAFTSHDNTVYHIVIPKDSFEEGFEILAESILKPAFPEEELEKEKRVIIEEIKMGEDNPQIRLFKELFLINYEGHPYGRPIIGFEETIKRIGRKELLEYFRKHYRPEEMIVVVVGDIEEERVKTLLEKTLKELKGRERDVEEKKKFVFPSKKKKILEMDIKESYIAIAYPVPPITHEDLPFLEVVSSILGDGESARLKEELKERRAVVTDITSFVSAQEDSGLFIIYATFNGRTYENVIKAVEEIIKEIKERGVEEWEMIKAKNRIRASHVYAKETAEGRAREIGYFYSITGDKNFLENYMERIERVRKEDIKRIVEKYLDSEKGNVVVLLPTQKNNPYELRLENGLRVLLNKNTFSESFTFRIGFPGGLKEEEEGKNGIFNLLSRMLLKGTEKYDARSIAKKIDILSGEISPFCGRNLFGLSGRFLSKDLKEALELLFELIARTSFREEELERIKREVLSELRQKEDNPLSLSFRSFEKVFYEGHPYAKDFLGSEEDIGSISIEDLRRYYREFVGPKHAVLAISGLIDIKATEEIIRELFSSWNGKGRPLKAIPYKGKRMGEKVKIEKDIRQAHIIVGFEGVDLLSKERYIAEVLDAVLGRTGGRIYKILREEKAYAYATTFFNRMAFDAGEMGIYIATNPNLVEEVMEVIEKEIEKMKKDGFSEKEVEDAKKFLIGNHLIAMQSNEALSSHMCIDTLYGFEPDFLKRWLSLIKEVKREDLENFLREKLSLKKSVTVILTRSMDPQKRNKGLE